MYFEASISKSAPKRFNKLSQKAQLGCIAALSVLLLSALQWLLLDRDASQRHLHQYGGMVAEQLSRLSKDAMVREDTIALNVLAEQVASDSAIASITIYSINGRTLASYGTALENGDAAYEFNRPIQLADATAGFVRVQLNSTAQVAASESSPLLHGLTQAWRPLASLVGAALLLWGIISWLTSKPLNLIHSCEDDSRTTADEVATTRRVLLLAVRLFNSAEMSSARRDALMDTAKFRIADVARLYGAHYLPIEPGAFAIIFAVARVSDSDTNKDTDDQRFHAACAALAIARLCNQPGGARFRYSLQEASLPLTDGLDPEFAELSHHTEDILADSMLYAALASDNTIALSASYARALERPERLDLTREHSPALAGLQTENAQDYYLLSGANAVTESMLNHQVEALTS